MIYKYIKIINNLNIYYSPSVLPKTVASINTIENMMNRIITNWLLHNIPLVLPLKSQYKRSKIRTQAIALKYQGNEEIMRGRNCSHVEFGRTWNYLTDKPAVVRNRFCFIWPFWDFKVTQLGFVHCNLNMGFNLDFPWHHLKHKYFAVQKPIWTILPKIGLVQTSF